jgi:hypothetical protein
MLVLVLLPTQWMVLEAPRMDPQSWPGEPQDCNQAAQECTAEQDKGVQWRSL